MRAALEAARSALQSGQAPVGARLVLGGQAIATGHNAVIESIDATAHAEMVVIREACRTARRLELGGATLYTTVEPCAMCLAACHYAGIGEVRYGASLEFMQSLTGAELAGPPAARAGLTVVGGLLAADSEALLAEWRGAA